MNHLSIKLPDVIQGDTWDGLSQVKFTTTGNELASPLSSVRMTFRDSEGTAGLSLTSAGSNISITNAAAWTFAVLPITPFPLAAGVWNWSIECTDTQGRIKTRTAGTIRVTQDATT